MREENLYYARTGRYTARVQDLEAWTTKPDNADLLVTVGAAWLQVRTTGASGNEFTVLSWRTDGPPAESGYFSSQRNSGKRE